MPLSLLHRRRRLGQAPVPLRTPNNFASATFASHPVADHVIAPDIDDENDSLSASSSSSTDVATSPTVSWLTIYQPSDADTLDNSTSMSSSSSSDLEAMASNDLFPTDMWSIAQRAATLGRRRYIALPSTSANNTVAARASHVHALVTQQILPQHHHSGSAPRILIVWATASRAARSRGIMRGLFTSALLAGTHPDILHPGDVWGLPGETNVPNARPVLSCSPKALLRCEEEILPLNPTIVFAEMPVPDLGDDDDDDSSDDDYDAKGTSRKLKENKIKINSRKVREDRAAAATAELWHSVAGFAGSAGSERSRVYTFLDPGAAADRRVARRLRSMMRLEGVEVPPLVARMAEAGIADPVDGGDDDHGGDKDGGGDGVEGDGGPDEGGVSLGRC